MTADIINLHERRAQRLQRRYFEQVDAFNANVISSLLVWAMVGAAIFYTLSNPRVA